MSLNAYNPQCTLDQCLNQVIGSIYLNPAAQVSACVSQFGSPATVTLTNIPDVVFSTSTVTVPYTDIIISTSTAYSTVLEAATSYLEVPETVTEFTATRVSTETIVATQPAVTFYRKRDAKIKKRGGCKPRGSSTASSEEPLTTSESAIEEPSTTSSAPNCVNLEQYSSACSCIGAVSDATQVVTLSDAVPTSFITETFTSTAPASISTSVVTVIVTETQTQLATTTATKTLETVLDSVETATSTIPGGVVLAPTVTAFLRANPENRLLALDSGWVRFSTGNAGKVQLVVASGRIASADSPNDTLVARRFSATAPYGNMVFTSVRGTFDTPATCVPDKNGILSCATADGVFNTVYSCGTFVYLAPAGGLSGCTEMSLTLSLT
ncbi:hypothetical protein QBC42DRAFT_290003 [Cladorrhinum samala]|uniref:Uncharacterized protein n=1 Tax=Cladorrhinum samala TaxID=585594 RepID=A0AAV9HHN0_9PEZI|nr:hypothetical protein QBC42DRAFT_290003 [Cladorrhinum samala]